MVISDARELLCNIWMCTSWIINCTLKGLIWSTQIWFVICLMWDISICTIVIAWAKLERLHFKVNTKNTELRKPCYFLHSAWEVKAQYSLAYITCIFFYFWLTITVRGAKWPRAAERCSTSTVIQTELCLTFLSKKISNCSLVTWIGTPYLSLSQQILQPLSQYRGRPGICGLLLRLCMYST